MQVSIKFDTEKENLEDLKRLVVSLQDLIKQRESGVIVSQPNQIKQPEPAVKTGNTAGGGRIIPYEDMSGQLSAILSRQKIR